MMGRRRSGLRPRSNSTNSISTLFNVEQVRVVDIFGPNYMSCNTTPTIYYLGGTVDGLGVKEPHMGIKGTDINLWVLSH